MAEKTTKPKNKVWSQFVAPILALSVICCIMSFLLAMTNSMTAPIIAENTRKTAEEARQALLPEADGFEEIPLTADVEGVTALYGATNGTGYVVECYGKGGYGGNVPAMVAFDPEGTIVGVTFLQNNETPGLGKKLETDPSFSAQFDGLPAQPVTIDEIDKIASSTISTNAALRAINAAIDVYNGQIHGQGVDTVAEATTGGGEEEAA